MRLHRLEIAGFGPFRAKQVVDFDVFTHDGLFLIAGRTGAGKSSILDAVSFALYNAVPRYPGGDKRLRSDHAEPDEPSLVTLEFSVNDERYRVERAPEYVRTSKRNPNKATKQTMDVKLFRRDGDQWVGLGARAVDVDRELLPEILQLTKDQFQQVILLAQNRFARFLLAKSDERLGVLRTLFGTKRFEDYAADLDVRRKASDSALAADSAVLNERIGEAESVIQEHELGGEPTADELSEPGEPAIAAPTTPADRLAAIDAALPRARYRVDVARDAVRSSEAAHEAAATALAAARAQHEGWQQRAAARASFEALEAQAPEIGELAVQLAAAQAAEVLRESLARTTATATIRAAADTAATDAQAAWDAVLATTPAVFTEPSTNADAVQARRDDADALTELIGSLTSALEVERGEADRDAAVDAAKAQVVAAEAQRTDVLAALEQLPERIAAATARREAAAPLALQHDAATAAITASRDVLTAAKQAQEAEIAAVAADREQTAAWQAHCAAGDALSALMTRRLAGHAAELASELRPGTACAVCGATEHPNPATTTEAPVTESDIAEAEALKAAAAQRDADTATAAKLARTTLADWQTKAVGKSVEAAAQDLAAAEAQAADCARAVQEFAAATAERDALVAEQQSSDVARETASVALTTAKEAAATSLERQHQARAETQAARGAFPDVAARLAAVRAAQRAATALATALDDAARKRIDEEDAAETVARLLEASSFETASDAEVALRSAAFRADAERQIQAHNAALERDRAVLLHWELEMLPEEPIDVLAPSERAASARDAWVTAQSAVTSAVMIADRLAALAESATEAQRQLGTAAEAHAVIARLADTVNGREPNTMRMSLETFVLAAELEEIVTAANVRLDAMSAGRYRLMHTDERAARGAASGLGIEVFDSHTGQARPASSLSGGETFLASLALALGLAEVVTARAGGMRLDTLFIDEGFGSLDSETLDLAMHTLEELRAGGRTVGVISHVESMHERIPARIDVDILLDGSSSISQHADSLEA